MSKQTVTNISAISALLAADVKENNTTAPLAVIGANPAQRTIDVQAGSNADLKLTLRGIAGVTVNSTVTVNLDSGELEVTSAPAAAAKAGPKTDDYGCNDASMRMC